MDVALFEPEQLALAKAGEERSGEELAPDFLERMKLQQSVGFRGIQEHGSALRDLAAFHLRHGIRPVVLARLFCRTECAVQEAGQIVEALGPALLPLALEQRLDIAIGDEVQLLLRQFSRKQM